MARVSKSTAQALKSKRTKLDHAKNFRKAEKLDDLWVRLLDLYRGKYGDLGDAYDDYVSVNVVFATMNVILPSVAVNYPKSIVQAIQPEDADKAAIAEAVTNYWWRHLDLLPEVQLSVKDMLMFGLGWLKTGWRYVEEEQEDPEAYQAALDRKIAEADQFAQENPHLAADLPTDQDIADSIPQTRLHVVEDSPFVERVSIHDVFVDPEATSMRDATWVAQRIIRDLNDVRKDDRYNQAPRASVTADVHLSDDWASPKERSPWRNQSTDESKRVTIWEWYDIKGGTMCVFAEQGDGYLVDPIKMPYVFGHPYIDLRDYDVPDQFYPMGELESLEGLQHELNATRSAMFNDRKRWRRAWLYRANAFDRAGVEALQSDADNRLIPINDDTPLSDVMVPLPTDQPNVGLYQDSDLIEQDITNISGVSEYMRGGVAEIRRTATEASIIQDAANARAADKLARVERYLGIVSRRLVQLAQQYLQGDQVAHIVGANGKQIWVPFSRDDIQGEFKFSIEGGSTRPYNDTLRRQTAIDMLQALGPMLGTGALNDRQVLARILKDGFDISDPSSYLGQGPPAAPQGGPSPDQLGPPQGGPPPGDMADQMAAGTPPPGTGAPGGLTPDGIPPEVLQQLSGQVGLQLPQSA